MSDGTARIDRATLLHVADLARLEVAPEEEERLLAELRRIVEWAGALPPAEAAAGPAEEEVAEGAAEGAAGGAAGGAEGRAAAGGGEPRVPLGDGFRRNAPAVAEGHLRLPPIRRRDESAD